MDLRLDLDQTAAELTAALCDVASVSGTEGPLADAVEAALRAHPHLRIDRHGDTVVARTGLGRATRVVVAGHLDTVPIAGNLPTRRQGDVLWGRGTTDMKGGVAVALRLAAHLAEPQHDVTYVFYDNEEVAAARNGLGLVSRERPDLLAGDFAVLMEPTSALVESGCNGTLRAGVILAGTAAHSARPWMGVNAIHLAGPVLDRLRGYVAEEIEVDGLAYRESLNAIGIEGGIAGNVIPDRCVVSVNYRFAPDKDEAAGLAYVREFFTGYEVQLQDSAPGARPGHDRPAAAEFVATVGTGVRAKDGWTDVARFSALGVPAVNYGPGDPLLAHADDERVDIREIERCETHMRSWLTGAGRT